MHREIDFDSLKRAVLPQINWGDYSEEQLQDIIEQAFVANGYTVRNVHKADRSHEEGADLWASRDAEQIAIAVKIKPKKSDREQLGDLEDTTATKRIYAYASPPTESFVKRMKKSKGVEFWGVETLTLHLFSLCPSMITSIALDHMKFSIYLFALRNWLLKILARALPMSEEEHEKLKKEKPTHRLLHLLWIAKDRASSIHKILMAFREFLDNLLELDLELEPTYELKMLEAVTRMSTWALENSLRPLYDVLSDLHSNFPDLLLRVASATRFRSNWAYLLHYKLPYSPSSLNETLERSNEDFTKLMQFFNERKQELVKDDDYSQEDNRCSDALSTIAQYFKASTQALWALEEIVDDLFQSITWKKFDDFSSDWRNLEKRLPKQPIDSPSFEDIFGLRERGLEKSSDDLLTIKWFLEHQVGKPKCPKCSEELILLSTKYGLGKLKCPSEKCDYEYE